MCFFFFSVESVRGIDASGTHGPQSNQLVFQRVVVRYWLERTARRRCRHGIFRIILVFAPTGARATTINDHSGKAGEEKLISFQYATACCAFISNDYHLTMMRYRIGVAHARMRPHSPPSEAEGIFPLSHLIQFHLPQMSNETPHAISATVRILRTSQKSTFSRPIEYGKFAGTAVIIIHHE